MLADWALIGAAWIASVVMILLFFKGASYGDE
jgi:hypothetical protein